MERRDGIKFIFLLLTVILLVSIVVGDDVKCLQGVKESLKDPQGKLHSWSFSNTSRGFICNFVGVTCWNDKENRVVDLSLPTMNLAGVIPQSLQFCESLTTLDLSGNEFSGTIPSQICTWLPYLVTLDLSHNDLSGGIPSELVRCKYLNNLILSDNRLSGTIPNDLSQLQHLKRLSVANNNLAGSIPLFLSDFNATDLDGNRLCGRPLETKCGLKRKDIIIIVVAGVCGAVVSLVLTVALWWCRCHRKR